jgi:hypothetical protein
MFTEIYDSHPNLVQGTIVSSAVTAFGGLWANVTPDEVVAWVTTLAGLTWTLTNIGLLIYQRVQKAIRDDRSAWHEHNARLRDYHAGHTQIEARDSSGAADTDREEGGSLAH